MRRSGSSGMAETGLAVCQSSLVFLNLMLGILLVVVSLPYQGWTLDSLKRL